MKIGTQAVALGGILAQKKLAVIANNIANINTPGFKKEVTHFKDFVSQNTHTKWDQGSIRQTDNPYDLALEGDGFFKVQTADGVRYTRAGNLKLSKDNTLVTQQGYPILGRTGPIKLTNKTFRVDESGQVFDGDQSVATLDLVRFDAETTLVREKEGLVKPASDTTQTLPADRCSVRQNYLEAANFDLIEEMTNMVETLRVYEAYQKAFKTGEKDLDSQLISKLGSQ